MRKADYEEKGKTEVQGRNVSDTGALSELRISVDLITKRYCVFRSVSPSSPFDLITYKQGVLKKIEVRTGRKYKPTGKKFFPKPKGTEWDVLAVYFPNEDVIDYYDKNFIPTQI